MRDLTVTEHHLSTSFNSQFSVLLCLQSRHCVFDKCSCILEPSYICYLLAYSRYHPDLKQDDRTSPNAGDHQPHEAPILRLTIIPTGSQHISSAGRFIVIIEAILTYVFSL
ncbi:hypothetical protein ACMFMF_006866 [Clarireedia jacksonii]